MPAERVALFGALLTSLVSLAALLTTAPVAPADTTIYQPFGTTTFQDRYVMQNNRWGTNAT